MTMINIPSQNNVDTSKKLTWEARLNISADELATQALTNIVYTTPSKPIFHYISQAKKIQLDQSDVQLGGPHKTQTNI
eukprot:2375880-Ditylum_brightwellii.AAC.1